MNKDSSIYCGDCPKLTMENVCSVTAYCSKYHEPLDYYDSFLKCTLCEEDEVKANDKARVN